MTRWDGIHAQIALYERVIATLFAPDRSAHATRVSQETAWWSVAMIFFNLAYTCFCAID